MDNNKPYSNLDALQELDAYDAAIEKACKYLKGDLEEDLEESYSDDFAVEDDWGPKATIDEEGNITFHHKS